MAVNKYNPNTGKPLKKGETVTVKGTNTTVTQGKTGTGTTSLSKSSTSSSSQAPNKYNPNTGELLKPGETVQIKGTNTYVTQGKVGTSNTAPEKVAEDEGLNAILNNPNLTGDQKKIIESIYGAVKSNDKDAASRVQAAMAAATEYSDPYFKAQVRLATDALERGLAETEGDLSYQEEQQRRTLEELRQNTSASKDYLSFQHQQELAQLARKYEQDLQTTQENLAATGFTSSSRRARAEQLLTEQNQGLVESSNKQFGYQTGNLDRALNFKSTDTAAQIENYRRLASEGKIDLLRSTEEKTGSGVLSDLGYSTLGGVGGTIPRQQAQDAIQFASNFVF